MIRERIYDPVTDTYEIVNFGLTSSDVCQCDNKKDEKTIVLISGKAGSGKNEFAKHMKQHLEVIGNYKVIEDMFAKSLKDLASKITRNLRLFLKEVMGNVSELVEEHTLQEQIERELDLLYFSPENFFEDKTPLTRILLEMIGTDIIREINPNWHIEKLIERTRQQEFDFKLVTDTRFENEIALTENTLTEYRVISIRINRDNVENNTHISNTALDYFHGFDYVLENNGTIDDLKLLAQQIAEQIEV